MMICVVDILKILNGGDNFIYPMKNYNKIGKEVVDNFNMFVRDEKSLAPFKLITSKDRINFSVQNKLYGKVTLNPIQAKKLNMPKELDNIVIYKDKTIIRDGKLNVEKLELIVDPKTYVKLGNLGINMEHKEANENQKGFHIIIDLRELPIVDAKYQNFDINDIEANLNKSFELEAKQKMLNYLLSELPVPETIPGMNKEQTELAEQYGIGKYLNYTGIDLETKDTKETYKADIIQLKLKGLGSIPKITDIFEKFRNGKKLNAGGQIAYDYYLKIIKHIDAIQDFTQEDLSVEDKRNLYISFLNDIKGQLMSLRLQNLIMRCVLITLPLEEIAYDATGKYEHNNLIINKQEKEFEK